MVDWIFTIIFSQREVCITTYIKHTVSCGKKTTGGSALVTAGHWLTLVCHSRGMPPTRGQLTHRVHLWRGRQSFVACRTGEVDEYLHIDRSHRNVWRNFSRLLERKPHPLVGKICAVTYRLPRRERRRHAFEGVRRLFEWRGQVQILRQAQSSWISCYRQPIRVEWLPECYATVAACRVRPHFLLLHRAPWSLHTTGAAPMEDHLVHSSDHLVHSSDHLVHSSDCALIQSCKHYLASVWSSITTTCAINLAENVTVHFFPLLARTCARKGVKTMAIRCRRYPLKMKKPCCKSLRTFSTSCWGEHITYSWQYNEEKIARKKRTAASGWH